MQTAFTLVGVGVGNILVVLVHPSAGRIVVSHVGERDNTETHTQMAEEAGLKGLANIICVGKLFAEVASATRRRSSPLSTSASRPARPL